MTAPAEPPRAPERRGRLVVARRVVEKLAAQAAVEVTGTGEHRTVFAPTSDTDPRPRVEVQVDGSDTWLQLEVGLVYPAPLRVATDELRTHLVRRVEQLSGLTVRRLDIRVARLVAADDRPRSLR